TSPPLPRVRSTSPRSPAPRPGTPRTRPPTARGGSEHGGAQSRTARRPVAPQGPAAAQSVARGRLRPWRRGLRPDDGHAGLPGRDDGVLRGLAHLELAGTGGRAVRSARPDLPPAAADPLAAGRLRRA